MNGPIRLEPVSTSETLTLVSPQDCMEVDPRNTPYSVALVIDEGATLIDFAGPSEVFMNTAEATGTAGFSVYTVAPTRRPLKTEGGGVTVVPDFTFDDAPQPDIIVVGAQSGSKDPAKLEWLSQSFQGAQLALIVCTGIFTFAETGLLANQEATTHHDFYDRLEAQFPKIRVRRWTRFVDNGKIISAGGLTSGINGALHVVARLFGDAAAGKVARFIEFQPGPQSMDPHDFDQ